ncbi:hypothetical protein GTP44_07455 [Duganella sp. FT50W]|uniref:Uncharacterized protein n=1 Tax=Duganella lactea TaxID=2692173 RepID=A0A6L8MFX9_9BURK|nr:hypothetical protein [Duganella lactea]MYM81793.1 hypothetical protein [Duganella lactea]
MTTTLCLNTYAPNIKNVRVLNRIKDVLDWCGHLLLRKKKPRSIHHSEIRKVFGNASKPLGRWLYSNLLMQTGDYAAGHHSYSYALNEGGYERLRNMVGLSTVTSAEIAMELYGPIIRGELTPVYRDKGGRRYHPIQNIRRDDKKVVFSGWWDYDIDSCAATLVHQYARQHYRWVNPETTEEPFPAVARFVEEKASVRQHLATVAGIPLEKAKELSQSLLFLAPLTPHHRCSIFSLLGDDRIRLQRLKQDTFVKQLIVDLKKMWHYAMGGDQRERGLRQFAGVGVASPPDSKSKYRQAIFIALERKVMDVIHDWFGTEQFPGVLMHDGFISRRDVDTHALESYLLDTTGYEIRLKKELLGLAGAGA